MSEVLKNRTIKITIGTIILIFASMATFFITYGRSDGVREANIKTNIENIKKNEVSIVAMRVKYDKNIENIKDNMLNLVEGLYLIKGALQIN